MSDLPRWRSPDGGASPPLRALLDAAADPEPGSRERVWSAVTATVAVPAAAAPPATAAATATASSLKPFALLLALAVASHRDQRAEPGTQPAVVARAPSPAALLSPPRAVASPRPAVLVTPPEALPPAPRRAHTPSPRRVVAAPAESAPVAPVAPIPTPAAPISTEAVPVATELDVLQRAMTALDTDPARAFALTQEAAHSFPAGSLEHEREALAIDALARLGRRDEATARARAFLTAHPSSTQAPRVRAVEQRLASMTNP